MMNRQFKKVTLSAMLMSALAAPAITNADSSEQAPETKQAQAVTATVPAADFKAATFIASGFADPLELAQKYAPDTVEDWKQTLEQFKKTVGNISGAHAITNTITAVPAAEANGNEPAQGKEGSFEKVKSLAIRILDDKEMKSLVVAPENGASGEKVKDFVISILDDEGVETLEPAISIQESGEAGDWKKVPASAVKMQKTEAGAITVISKGVSESDIAFLKAQLNLHKAAESKDAAAIKEALAKLLEQYKQQIADRETAAQSK